MGAEGWSEATAAYRLLLSLIIFRLSFRSSQDSPRNRAKSSGANPSALARSRSQKLEQMALLKNSQENAEGVVSKAAEKVKVEEVRLGR